MIILFRSFIPTPDYATATRTRSRHLYLTTNNIPIHNTTTVNTKPELNEWLIKLRFNFLTVSTATNVCVTTTICCYCIVPIFDSWWRFDELWLELNLLTTTKRSKGKVYMLFVVNVTVLSWKRIEYNTMARWRSTIVRLVVITTYNEWLLRLDY